MVFSSAANLTGQNPHKRVKVFLFDSTTDEISQLPPSPTAEGGTPEISADGTTVVYASGGIVAHDIATGAQTAVSPPESIDGAPSVSANGDVVTYLRDVTRGFLRPYTVQVTNLAMSTTIEIPAGMNVVFDARDIPPDISPDGTRVTYLGSNDPVGDNPDGSPEVFVHDLTTSTTRQVTSGPGRNVGAPRFVDDGTKLVFLTDGEFVGPNPPGEFHMLVHDIDAGTTTRMSDLGTDGIISEDAGRILFTDDANRDGANPEESYELFSFEVTTGAATQLTAFPDRVTDTMSVSPPAADGSVIPFTSTADLTGGNPDHNYDLFVATTCGPPPRPDAAIATAKTGPYVGDDLYAATAMSIQEQVATIGAGQTRRFFVQIQNDRDIPDTFTIQGTAAGSPGYQVRFIDGRTDVTPAVRAGSYEIGPLEPGETATLKIKITATTATAASGRRVDLTARSITNPVTPDTVRARVGRT